MIERRRYMGGEALPYDAEVEYLESTGTQWIDTGVKLLDDAYVIETEFVVSNAQMTVYAALFTNWQSSGNVYGFAMYDPTQTWVNPCVAGTQALRTPITRGDRYYLRMSDGEFILNETTYTRTGKVTNYAQNTLVLFKQNYNNAVLQSKMYNFKLEHSGDLVLDLIPVRVGQVGYMYDKVSKQLFGNSGTGNFVIGSDK